MGSAFCPDYTPKQLPNVGNRAVILGGSVAGLCVAKVLSDCFQEVVIIDRDQLPEQPDTRTGVPQDSHPHVIHGAARTALSRILPGFREELRTAGALTIDALSEFDLYQAGGYLAQGSNSMPMEVLSRPLFEYCLRKRVTDIPSITVRSQSHFVDYRLDQSERAINGVVVKVENATEEIIPADLVVDATGRMSRTSRWLQEHDFPAPEASEITVNLSYSSTTIDRPPGDRRAIWAPASPPRTFGGGILPIEDGQWQVNLHGLFDDDPPTNWSAYREYASRLPIDTLRDILDEQASGDEPIHYYPFTSSRRFHFEKLDRFPGNLVVIGDALASFNPIYGQGISVAAVESLLLHRTLVDGGTRRIGSRFFESARPLVSTAWRISTGTDLQHEETTGSKPIGADLQWWVFRHLLRKAQHDEKVSEAIVRVLALESKPRTMFRASVLWHLFQG